MAWGISCVWAAGRPQCRRHSPTQPVPGPPPDLPAPALCEAMRGRPSVWCCRAVAALSAGCLRCSPADTGHMLVEGQPVLAQTCLSTAVFRPPPKKHPKQKQRPCGHWAKRTRSPVPKDAGFAREVAGSPRQGWNQRQGRLATRVLVSRLSGAPGLGPGRAPALSGTWKRGCGSARP